PPRTVMAAESTKALRGGLDGDAAAVLADALVGDLAGDQREERVVAAFSDAGARADRRPSLANQDRARAHGLAPEYLHSQALGVGIAAVAGGPATFLMSHRRPPPPERPSACASASGRERLPLSALPLSSRPEPRSPSSFG